VRQKIVDNTNGATGLNITATCGWVLLTPH